MSFPSHIARLLEEYGVAAETRAALLDIYLQVGPRALDAFSDLAEDFPSPGAIMVDDLVRLRPMLVESYLRECHPQWLVGKPTSSFYAPRFSLGRGTGLVAPLGTLGTSSDEGFAADVAAAVSAIVGPGQPVPRGMLLAGKNGHYGGREETVSFDIVPESLDEAIAVGNAAGRQHTAPGSIGETSGTFDGAARLALIWEVQPNAYKPMGDRNRAIAKVWRRNRNWHIATLVAAIRWLDDAGALIFVLKGLALQATHEVNPREPVTGLVVQHHDRTVETVALGLGGELRELEEIEASLITEARLMNTGLGKLAAARGVAHVMRRLVLPLKDGWRGSEE